MDPMDVDISIEVPDTPDRPTTHGAHARNRAYGENHSTPLYSRLHDISNEGSRDHPMFIDSRSRGRATRPPKHFGSSNISATSSSRSTHVLRKGITEKKPTYQTHDSLHNDYQGSFVDLTESNMPKPGLGNVTSSLPGRTSFRTAREVMDNVSGNGSGNDIRVGNNIQERTGDGVILSRDPLTSPRVCKQKRLVRNGCISPNNVSKAKQLSGKEIDSSVASAHNNTNGSNAYSAPPISIDIRELVAEDSDCTRTRKGKGVMIHPCLSKEPDSENKNSQISRSINKDAGKSIEDLGGWRSTRNRNREINISSPDEDLHVIRGKSPSRYSSQPHESRFGGRERVASVSDGDDINPKPISLEHVHPHQRNRSGLLNGTRPTTSKIIKKKKHGSTSSTSGQCSTSVFDDQEVVLLNSPAEASYSRSTSGIMDNSNQNIGVGDISSQLRRNAHDEYIRAKQLEADELLARELQEQFYSEAPVLEFGELDENIAMSLQHQDDSDNVFNQARHPVLNERVSTSSSRRQPQTRASSSAPRGRRGRGSFPRSATGRMPRQRNRFPGQGRTLLSSRGRASLFPEDMDVETRMHILGALEEFNDMGLNAGILQDPRGFNENDYEMLLALDDNNDQHSGASARLINGLPESTVQSENFDEACAVCLDTPTIGDTIRHLPCLHKFHKDCIDQWLRRRTSCPICKSSVT